MILMLHEKCGKNRETGEFRENILYAGYKESKRKEIPVLTYRRRSLLLSVTLASACHAGGRGFDPRPSRHVIIQAQGYYRLWAFLVFGASLSAHCPFGALPVGC